MGIYQVAAPCREVCSAGQHALVSSVFYNHATFIHYMTLGL